MLIKESFMLAADDADVLAAPSRLAAIPANGILTIEAIATQSNLTNFGRLTLQLPEGDIPFQDLLIPSSGGTNSATDAIMDSREQFIVTLNVRVGGHVGLAYDETGTVTFALIYVTLNF